MPTLAWTWPSLALPLRRPDDSFSSSSSPHAHPTERYPDARASQLVLRLLRRRFPEGSVLLPVLDWFPRSLPHPADRTPRPLQSIAGRFLKTHRVPPCAAARLSEA